MEKVILKNVTCNNCENKEFYDGGDGFYYCLTCYSQVEDIHATSNDYSMYSAANTRTPVIATEDVMLDEEDFYKTVRMRYVSGLQLMIQFQCEALVKNFMVHRVICGLSGTIWLRFLAKTGVFDDDWADRILEKSENRKQGKEEDFKPHKKYKDEPHNLQGERLVIIWYRSLRKEMPLSISLAISFLVCHIVREAVLPTDIIKWSVEGTLPYFAAFLDIEKQMGPPSRFCPLSSTVMFRPSHTIGVQKLESLAAFIADTIGLHLPPVNFHGIATRYLQQLSLPIEKILPHACKIYEWSMPPDVWLSANDLRLPTRVGVMSILIVAIRILYNINGFGAWEGSFQRRRSSSSKADQEHEFDHFTSSKAHGEEDKSERGFELDASELLRSLDEKYKEIGETYDFSKDLPAYLQYCNDVVFAGLESSLADPRGKQVEEEITKHLCDFYLKEKDSGPCTDLRSRVKISEEHKKIREDARRDEAIRLLKVDMDEKRFSYVPPRVNLKRFDYLHYARKKDEGALTYIAHADYYVLLRACAKVVQIDIRILHLGVLSFERRLAWLEKRIDHCLHCTPVDENCEDCS